MTLNQFKGLDEIVQAEMLWSKGAHIATRVDKTYQYLLYQLDGFYVEILYHLEFEMIQQFKTFNNTDELDPYLQQINICSLILG